MQSHFFLYPFHRSTPRGTATASRPSVHPSVTLKYRGHID